MEHRWAAVVIVTLRYIYERFVTVLQLCLLALSLVLGGIADKLWE
jgi:hypothetical protein